MSTQDCKNQVDSNGFEKMCGLLLQSDTDFWDKLFFVELESALG